MKMLESPVSWKQPFQRMAVEVQLRSIQEAEAALQQFLNPVLSGKQIGLWEPLYWQWLER